jgi:hypothetical protein
MSKLGSGHGTLRSHRFVISAVLSVVGVLLLAIALMALTGERSAGPLVANAETELAFPLTLGQTATWGSPLPVNRTASDIVLRSIDPIDVSGLDIVGIVMSRPADGVGVINAIGFPPEGTTPEGVDGFVLRAAGSGDPQPDVLVGVTLATGATEGRIEGLRVRYVANGHEHDVDLPYALHILAAPH